jgi:hypothetical protein
MRVRCLRDSSIGHRWPGRFGFHGWGRSCSCHERTDDGYVRAASCAIDRPWCGLRRHSKSPKNRNCDQGASTISSASSGRRCCGGVEMISSSHKSPAPSDIGVSLRGALSSLATSAANDIAVRRRRPQWARVSPDDTGACRCLGPPWCATGPRASQERGRDASARSSGAWRDRTTGNAFFNIDLFFGEAPVSASSIAADNQTSRK